MQISEVAAGLSGLAVLVGAFVSYLVLRIQRDMAKLKNEILDGINGKYISRKEHEILCRDHEAAMREIKDNAKERAAQHHILHEEFITCRAAHGGKE